MDSFKVALRLESAPLSYREESYHVYEEASDLYLGSIEYQWLPDPIGFGWWNSFTPVNQIISVDGCKEEALDRLRSMIPQIRWLYPEAKPTW